MIDIHAHMKKIILTLIVLNISLPAPLFAVKQSDEEILIEKITEAKGLYNKAVVSYEEGNLKEAEKYYNKAIHKLYSADMDADLGYRLKDNFNNIFDRMCEFSKSTGTIIGPLDEYSAKQYIIPIDCTDRLTKDYMKFYTIGRGRKHIIGALERSGRYRDMILGILKEYNIPEELIYLPVVESFYKIKAYSRAGAAGLWQIMPHTGRNLGLVINYWIDERRDPGKSTRAAAKFLKKLYLWFNDWHLALAAYNRGENGLNKDIKFSKSSNFNELEKRKALPKETENFIPKFIACTVIGENYRNYGFELEFEEPLSYDEIITNKVIDLEIVAKCIRSNVSTLKKLNPAIRAWCTPPNYPNFKLKLPPGTKEAFLANIAKVKNLNPSRGHIRYKVRRGDVLGSIARKFRVPTNRIKQDNNIRNVNRLRIGQTLVIRPGRRYFKKDKLASGHIRYKVRRGDILGTIARKFHTTVSRIKKDNRIRKNNLIKIGQSLIIKPGKRYFSNL